MVTAATGFNGTNILNALLGQVNGLTANNTTGSTVTPTSIGGTLGNSLGTATNGAGTAGGSLGGATTVNGLTLTGVDGGVFQASNPYFSAIQPLFGPQQYAAYSQTAPLLIDLTGGGPIPVDSYPNVSASQFTPLLSLLGIV